ncbi:hypothetical protein BGZ65_004458, partial [Modicella reniformis]
RGPKLSRVGILDITSSPPSAIDQEVINYASTDGCRRRFLNTYFGNERQDVAVCCDNCSRVPMNQH